jgi:hypothetical protein
MWRHAFNHCFRPDGPISDAVESALNLRHHEQAMPTCALGGAASDGQVRRIVRRVAHFGFAMTNVGGCGGDRIASGGPVTSKYLGDAAQRSPDLIDGGVIPKEQAAIPAFPVVRITVGVARIDDIIEVFYQMLEIDEHNGVRVRWQRRCERLGQCAKLAPDGIEALVADRPRARWRRQRGLVHEPAAEVGEALGVCGRAVLGLANTSEGLGSHRQQT